MPVPLTPDAPRLLNALATGSAALLQRRFWSNGVNQLLQELGEASGVSRVWIFQLLEQSPSGLLQDYVFEWASTTDYRQLTQKRFRFFSMAIDDPEYADMVTRRQRGDAHACIVSQLSPGPLRENLESQAIRSMVTVPIMVNGQWWGTLGFDDCEREIAWEGSGLQALTIAAELIASAIYRHQLNSRKRQVDLLQRVAACGAWEVNPASGATWCSSGLLASLGYPQDYARLPLRRLLAHIVTEDRLTLWALLRQCCGVCNSSCRVDVRLIDLQGNTRWHELVIEAHYVSCGRLAGIAGLAIDISQRKQGEVQAQTEAEFDELTGAHNRRGMVRYIRELLESRKCQRPYLLLLDIDHFKIINDRYGHPAGDTLLKTLAKRLVGELRPDDCLVRLGGEEFAVVVGEMGETQVLQLAERLRCCIAEDPFVLDALPGIGGTLSACEVSVPMTVSLGVATMMPGESVGHCQSMAIAQADQALYIAKESGRNRVVAYWQR
ncbi:sensor domain-containing diguanylate cyclase [Halomonas vilamensis]|uniref:diguanylate cyclase n=1 Tax=Vreelandella vilamensis TaxID=531309 RepID=A0ABU1H565_9GAMM|nr:sensor domain-containing diguanylate cyclase [Halomonas vilamensis]MDR5899260.1 sensor domain-containing diguanylate cyclase [Halomonas vilamensis]